MSEMAQALRMLRSKMPLYVQKNPAGTYSFVGSVPVSLRWECDDPELIEIAVRHSESLARASAKRQGKTFRTCTWATEAEARAAAEAIGAKVEA